MAAQTVLIADRDADTREILALALSRAGFRPVAVQDGDAALAILRVEPVRLVVAELYLPCEGERCVVRAIKQHTVHRTVPVVAYTARVAQEDRDWAERQGCELFLPKPTSVGDLLDQLRAVLRRHPKRRRASSQA